MARSLSVLRCEQAESFSEIGFWTAIVHGVYGNYTRKHPRRRPGWSRHDEDPEILSNPKKGEVNYTFEQGGTK
jgi:hypothetical protein